MPRSGPLELYVMTSRHCSMIRGVSSVEPPSITRNSKSRSVCARRDSMSFGSSDAHSNAAVITETEGPVVPLLTGSAGTRASSSGHVQIGCAWGYILLRRSTQAGSIHLGHSGDHPVQYLCGGSDLLSAAGKCREPGCARLPGR